MNGVNPVLEVRQLRVRLKTRGGWIHAVNGIDFAVQPGEAIAVVGESGSGKSVTAMSIMRLLPGATAEISGEILFQGSDVLKLSERSMRRLRGKDLAVVFQDPATALNPVRKVGGQISEIMTTHLGIRRAEADEKTASILSSVGIFSPATYMRRYPHELSGGMRQRSVIAMGLSLDPRLLIADEPTTALDATIQAQVLTLIKDMTVRSQTALMLITHDLAVAATVAPRILVMYSGTIVETGPTQELLTRPRHPYTVALLRSVPRLKGETAALTHIEGSPPEGRQAPLWCPFGPRCHWRVERCWRELPVLAAPTSDGGLSPRLVACFNQPTKDEVLSGASGRVGFTPAPRPEGSAP